MNWNNSFLEADTKGYRSKHIIERPLSEGIRKEQAKLQKEAERQRRADEKQLEKERNTERLRALIERLKENEKNKEREAKKLKREELEAKRKGKAKEIRERYSKQKDKPSLSEEEKKLRAKSLRSAWNKSYYEKHKEEINAKRSVKSKTRKTTEGYGHISPNCWGRLRDLE